MNNIQSKTEKSFINVTFGVCSQFFLLILRFVSRTIFIKLLSAEYLGINGLFTNVLSVLALADLGFSGAIIYSLYKPLAQKDNDKISGLISFYKKAYNIFATLILIIGLLLIPILKYIVNLPENMPLINIYYIMFLLNTVASYLFAYKNTILEADQKSYIIRIYNMFTATIQFILQLIILFAFHNYLIYLIIQLLCTILNNLMGAVKVNKLYPYLVKSKAEITLEDKKAIYGNVKAMFINKLSNVVLTNTDNILISILVGTIAVGYYSNYYLIIASISSFVTIIFTSLYGSIGQHNFEKDPNEKEIVFKVLNYIAFIISSICSISLLMLFNDFIKLWIGASYVLSQNLVYIIVINFYINVMTNPLQVYRETTGVFNDTKYAYLILCVLNIILSIVFGKLWGMFGILIATIISKLLTTLWFEPLILFKKIFTTSVNKYYLNQIVKIIIVCAVYYVEVLIIKKLNINENILGFIAKAVITFGLSTFFVILSTYNTEEFYYFKSKVLNIIIKKINKKRNNNRS